MTDECSERHPRPSPIGGAALETLALEAQVVADDHARVLELEALKVAIGRLSYAQSIVTRTVMYILKPFNESCLRLFQSLSD